MFAIDSDRRPPVPAEGRRPVAPRTLFALALIAYVVVIAVFGRFASFDEIFYKAAGYHLAVDGHFAAPELIGRLPFNPPIEKVFACYPPLYPFVFGVYTKVVGFGPVRVALFDVWIHVILCIQSAALAWHFAAPAAAKPSRRAWVSALVGTALIPLGTPGRPDELAIVFGTAGLLALVVPVRPVVNVRRSLFVGIMAGLCAGTSIFAAATLGLIAVGLIVARRGQTLREKIRVFLWMLPAAGVVLALCFAPLLLVDVHALRQLFDHAMNNENVTTNDWRWAWKLGKPRFLAVAGLVAAAIVLLPAFWRARKHRDWLRLFAAPLLALAIIAVAAKGKSTYLFFIVPWLLAAVAGQLAQHSKGGRLTCLASGTLACAGIFVGSTPFAFERFVLINADADQRPAAAFARLAAEIPPNSTILTTGDSWAAVARANHVFDANAAGPEVAERIDCIVLTGNWSGVPGMPKPLREPFATMLATQFQLVDNHCARQPPTAFGKRLSNSAFGFGTAVFRRIDPIKRGQ